MLLRVKKIGLLCPPTVRVEPEDRPAMAADERDRACSDVERVTALGLLRRTSDRPTLDPEIDGLRRTAEGVRVVALERDDEERAELRSVETAFDRRFVTVGETERFGEEDDPLRESER